MASGDVSGSTYRWIDFQACALEVYIGPMRYLANAADDSVGVGKVWCVFDTSYDPGPSPLLHVASTQERADAWIAANQHESIYLYRVVEWTVDDD